MRTKTWIALSAAVALALGSAAPTFAEGSAQGGSGGGNAPSAAGSGGGGNSGAAAGANNAGGQSAPSNNAGNAGSDSSATSGGSAGSGEAVRGGQNANDSNAISSDNSDRTNPNRTDPSPMDQSPGSAGSIGGTGGASPQQPVDSPDGGTTGGTGNSGIGADGSTSDSAAAESSPSDDTQTAERDRVYEDASDTPSAREHAESARQSTNEPRDVRQDEQPVDESTEAADANNPDNRDADGNVINEADRTDNVAGDGTNQRDTIIRNNDGYYRENSTVVTGERDSDRNVNDRSVDRDNSYDDARPAGERQPARENTQPGTPASPEDLQELNDAKQEYEAQRQANIAYLMANNEDYRKLAEQRELLQARQTELTADPDADALAIEAGARELLQVSTQMRDIENALAPNDEARQRLEDSATRVRSAEEQPRQR